jgi:hypothetical protein
LAGYPNIQVTTLLFLILFEKNDKTDGVLSIVFYIVLQGLAWGFGLYLIGMTLGWFLYLVIAKLTVSRGIWTKATAGFLFAFIYGISFYPVTGIVYQTPFIAYIIADFPFALTMGVSNFISILWLYTRLERVLNTIDPSEAYENAL